MDIKHPTTLSQRLSSYVGRMVWMFFFCLMFAWGFFFQQAQTENQEKLPPSLQLSEKSLQLKLALQQAIDETLQQKHLTQLTEKHQQILLILQQLNPLISEPSLSVSINQLTSFDNTLLAITQDLPKNMVFLESAGEKLQISLNYLQLLIGEISAEKSSISQRLQTMQVNVNSSEIELGLAQSYVKLSEKEQGYQALQAILMSIDALLKNLSPFMELPRFDSTLANIQKDIKNWESQYIDLLIPNTSFNQHYKPLMLLVFGEGGIEQWRNTVQSVQAYFSFLHAEKSHLWQLRSATDSSDISTSEIKSPIPENVVNEYITSYLKRLNSVFLQNQVKWKNELIQINPASFLLYFSQALLCLMSLSFILFLFYGVKCKQLNNQLITSIELEHKDKASTTEFDSPEQENVDEGEEVIDISPTLDEENIKNLARIENLSQEVHNLQLELSTYSENVQQQALLLEEKQSVIATLEQSQKDLINNQNKALADLKNKQKKLVQKSKQMIVRTLLQSQSASIGTGGSALQVYRQLTRMFDWCSQLTTPLQSMSSSVNIYSEITAAMYKMMLEAQWQRNTVLLDVDTQALQTVDVNAGLFQRMLVYIGRLLLLDQFKSTLTLKIQPLILDEKNRETDVFDVLQFEFRVVADKNRKKIPPLVQEFIDTHLAPSLVKSEAVTYIYQLLNAVDGSNIKAHTNDLGYVLIFDLPLKETITIEKGNTESDQECVGAHFIALTNQVETINLIKQQCAVYTSELVVLESFDLVGDSIQRIHDDNVIIFLLAEDRYEDDFDLLNAFINQAANPSRYKMMVMQSSYHSAMQRQGLYSQASSPLFPDAFAQELQALVLSSASTNVCLAPEVMSQHQYQMTQAEVLFVSDKASTHQTLIRLLHWLGLQVNVVANTETMQRYWQSGRYLILITDLIDNPFVELSAGKSIKRAIFTIEDTNKAILTQMKVWAGERKEAKSWVVEELARFTDIESLVKQLSPWLKPKVLTASTTTKVAESSSVEPSKPVVNKACDDNEVIKPSREKIIPDIQKGFDLSLYAHNQGTPELAVYMLDEYLAELSALHIQVLDSVQAAHLEQALSLVKSMKLIALIMAATPLQTACEALLLVLNEGKTDELTQCIASLSKACDELIAFSVEL